MLWLGTPPPLCVARLRATERATPTFARTNDAHFKPALPVLPRASSVLWPLARDAAILDAR